MSIIAELRVPADDFILGRTMAERPDLRMEFERFIPTSLSRTMAYLWIAGDDLDSLRAVTETDPTVEELRFIDDLDRGGLFQATWDNSQRVITDACANGDETLIQAVGKDDEWFLKIRFESRDSLSTFQSRCDEKNMQFDLLRLYDIQAPKLGQYDLSTAQHDAVVTALELGYFDVQRNCELTDVAAELDLSVNAVSERIRRGEANLFRSALTVPRPPHRTTLD